MAKVYTKTGDKGMTSLAGGKRVSKHCARLEAYGEVDELNSGLGWLLCEVSDEKAKNILLECQNVLFCIGAILATGQNDVDRVNAGEGDGVSLMRVRAEDVALLESQMDEWNATLPGWRGFVLPGGVESASRAHVCRTVCRRAERRIFALADEVALPEELLKYVNRLSDFLFVLALHENFLKGKDEIIWQKRG